MSSSSTSQYFPTCLQIYELFLKLPNNSCFLLLYGVHRPLRGGVLAFLLWQASPVVAERQASFGRAGGGVKCWDVIYCQISRYRPRPGLRPPLPFLRPAGSKRHPSGCRAEGWGVNEKMRKKFFVSKASLRAERKKYFENFFQNVWWFQIFFVTLQYQKEWIEDGG